MAPKGRHPRESEAVLTELMMPHHANIMGNVFGGHILALVDRVAAVAAIRHSHRACVTVSVDKVDFREPIHVGELVTALARVIHVVQIHRRCIKLLQQRRRSELPAE